MKKVLILSKSCGSGLGRERLQKLFFEKGLHVDFGKLDDTLRMEGYEGLIVGMDPVTDAVLSRAPQLHVVMKFGVGTENIDRNAAKNRNITVLNLPGVNSEAVAEMAFALMICAARRVAEGDRQVRSGQWPRLVGQSLSHKTLGIVGTGMIGRTLASYCTGFSMRLIGYDAFPSSAFEDLGGQYVPLDELLQTADFISVHVPLMESTHHLIASREFEMMKPTAILVNTARGPIIDEQALYMALSTKKIAAAGLDVFEHEPVTQSPLLQLDNAVCLPHIAALSHETMEKMDCTCAALMSDALLHG